MSEVDRNNANESEVSGDDTITAAAMPVIHVVGMGMTGADSLSATVLALVKSATLVVGGQRHLDAFKPFFFNAADSTAGMMGEASAVDPPEKASVSPPVAFFPLGNFTKAFDKVRSHLVQHPQATVIILASGDPLFFGLGRLLLSSFPAEQLMFHPQVSSMQLAFSRLKLPWQDATLLSVHGRDEQQLIKALQRGDHKIAVLTDGVLTPGAIFSLLCALELPISYQLWVCENLGDKTEQVSLLADSQFALYTTQQPSFAPLNVVVLIRSQASTQASDRLEQPEPGQFIEQADLPERADSPENLLLKNLPLIGLPDSTFKGFPDRPTLMTKREVRLLILGALAPLPGQTIWDIGAGTGSISVELSRLCPSAQIYAIEKTAMGAALIRHNAQRLAIAPITVIHGKAPTACADLPTPDRVFIGGSSGQLSAILNGLDETMCGRSSSHSQATSKATTEPDPSTDILPARSLFISRRIVLALATLEHLAEATTWLKQPHISKRWQHQLTQINVARSLPVGSLTRFHPLNPVTLITLTTKESSSS